MGKSLDYIKYRVLEHKNTNLDIAFDNAFEVSPKQFLKFNENNQLSLVWKNDDADPKLDISVKVTYDPDADFKYFTTSSSRHDGTMLFVYENIEACLKKSCLCRLTMQVLVCQRMQTIATISIPLVTL